MWLGRCVQLESDQKPFSDFTNILQKTSNLSLRLFFSVKSEVTFFYLRFLHDFG